MTTALQPNGRHSPNVARSWKAVRSFGAEGFTARALHEKIGKRHLTISAVKYYVAGLVKVGAVRIVENDEPRTHHRFQPHRYLCIRPDGPPPRIPYGPSSGRHGATLKAIWNGMRATKEFMIHELTVVVATPDVPVTAERTKEFVCALVAAGIVQKLEQRRLRTGGTAPAVYRLTARGNTGPRPPVMCRKPQKGIFDENRQVFHPARSRQRDEVSA